MSFVISVEYPGYDHNYDRQIEKAVRRSSGGGGYSLLDQRRDLSFYFQGGEAAKNAAKRVRAMKPKRRGTRVRVSPVGD